MMGFGGMGWGLMPFGMIGMVVMVVVWVAVIGLIVWAVTRLLPGRSAGGRTLPKQDSPSEILDRRFARGEIDLETYQMQLAAVEEARRKASR